MNNSNISLTDYATTVDTPNNYLTDYDAIVKAIQHYIDGCKAGQSELMHPGFHPDATMVGYALGNFLFGPVKIPYDSSCSGGVVNSIWRFICSSSVKPVP